MIRFTCRRVALPHTKQAMKRRRLIVVDIENVVEGAVVTEGLAQWARNIIETAVSIADDEQVVVAMSHVGLLNTSAAWPTARLRVRSGQDGADRELLQVLQTERIAERFDEVVLVSGDGIFTDVVSRLGGQGVRVTAVAWKHCMSARLRLAASATVLLDDGLRKLVHLEVA